MIRNKTKPNTLCSILAVYAIANALDAQDAQHTPQGNARFIAEYLKKHGDRSSQPIPSSNFGIPKGADTSKYPHEVVYKIDDGVISVILEYHDRGLPDGGADGKLGQGDTFHLTIGDGTDYFHDCDVDGKLSPNSSSREYARGYDNQNEHIRSPERLRIANERYADNLRRLRAHFEKMMKK